MMGKGLLIAGIIVLLLCVYPALYIYSLSTVDIKDFQLTDVKLGKEGITFSGTLTLVNNGFVGVTIDRFDYAVIFEPTKENLGTGTMQGMAIATGSTASTQLSHTVRYPSLDDLAKLLQSKEANMNIDGKATAVFLFIPLSTDFHITFDVKQYLEQYVKQRLGVM